MNLHGDLIPNWVLNRCSGNEARSEFGQVEEKEYVEEEFEITQVWFYLCQPTDSLSPSGQRRPYTLAIKDDTVVCPCLGDFSVLPNHRG